MDDWANLAKQQINEEYNEDKRQQNEEYNEDKGKKRKKKENLEQFTLLCYEGICVNYHSASFPPKLGG